MAELEPEKNRLWAHYLVEELLRRIVKRFRGGLVFKAHRPTYHSTPSSRVVKNLGEAVVNVVEDHVEEAVELARHLRGAKCEKLT